ncbi:unnamed protein product [Durusdinium trenchii]
MRLMGGTTVAYNAAIAEPWWCALTVLELTRVNRLSPDAITYSATMSVLGQVHWLEVVHLLKEMQTVSLEADVISFNASISACGRNSQWRRAMHLVHAARHGGGDSTVVTCNAAMSACEVSGFWQNALQLFQDLQEDDQPDIISYCALISSCEKGHQWQAACHFLQQLEAPSEVAFSAAISATEKALEWPMALHLLNQMRHSRQGSLVATNAAISACEKCGRWEHALALLKDLEDQQLLADVISYSTAVSAMAKGTQWVFALGLLQKLRLSEVRPNVISYNAALCASAAALQQQIAWELFSALHTDVVEPDVVTYCAVASQSSFHKSLTIMELVAHVSLRELNGLRNQIQGLQQLARGLEEHNEEGDTEVWQLSHEDAALLGEESPLTPEALILQRSVRSHEHGIHGPSQLRLNSHMMELSMKASEAVDALGHSNWKPSVLNGLARHSVYSMANASQSASGIVLPGCGRVKAVPPDSKFRIAWDLFGMMLMVCDAFVLPVCMAWDLNITPFPQTYWERGMLQVFAIVSLAFWPLDIALNFFTGFHVKGHYNYALWAIAKRYMMTWFAFDLSVVTIDYGAAFTITGTEDDAAGFLQPLRSARYLRVLRMVRILRILKAGKVNVMLENLVIAMGRQWLILAFMVGKMLMAIGLVTHILTCLWFWLGKLVHEEGIRKSWLDLANVTELDLGLQYAHSASWILLPPSPPTLEPDSRVERLASLMCFVTTVLVIGSALSILTGTLNEIRQVNNERSKKRRELRIFLQTRRVPTELLMRVMSYADYKIARHSPVSYDSSLISPMLEAELAIVNFGNILTEHPVFNMVRTLFPNIFADLCNSLEKRYFCEMEYVFHAGTLVEMMYITSHGTFSLMKDKKASKVNTFTDERHYFGEVALYVEAALHPFALQTASFAEVFVLSVSRLTNVLVNSPLCATMFVEYATDFIGRYKVPMQPTWEEVDDLVRLQEECARESCANNSFALPINLDSRKYLAHLDLRYIQADPTCSTQAALETLEDSEMDPARTVLKEFIAEVVHSEEASAAETLLKLREAYVELDVRDRKRVRWIEREREGGQVPRQTKVQDGLHARFSEPMEQERAESGILSLIALVRRDYEMFVTPQKADMALSRAQWDALQDILEWAQPNPDKLAGAMFLVAIKGLGKFRSLTGQMPREDQRPEKALLYLLRFHPHAVPSLNEMSEEAQEFVIGILELQQSFNFAQMLQAENVPANLAKLQAQIRERQGIDLLKFYVLFLLAFMSGLAGGRGSRLSPEA